MEIRTISDVLILEDNPDTANFFSHFLTKRGFEASVRCNRDPDALFSLKDHKFDLIFLDYNMPGLNAEDTLAICSKLWPNARIALLTATHDARAIGDKLGIAMVIEKPFDPDHILTRLNVFATGRYRPAGDVNAGE